MSKPLAWPSLIVSPSLLPSIVHCLNMVLIVPLLFFVVLPHVCVSQSNILFSFACLDCFISGVLLYGFFHELFFSVSILFLRFIHVEPHSCSSSPVFSWWHILIWPCCNLFFHFPIDGHWVISIFPPITKDAALNILTYLLVPLFKSYLQVLLEFWDVEYL